MAKPIRPKNINMTTWKALKLLLAFGSSILKSSGEDSGTSVTISSGFSSVSVSETSFSISFGFSFSSVSGSTVSSGSGSGGIAITSSSSSYSCSGTYPPATGRA